jgi:hypothetical protein
LAFSIRFAFSFLHCRDFVVVIIITIITHIIIFIVIIIIIIIIIIITIIIIIFRYFPTLLRWSTTHSHKVGETSDHSFGNFIADGPISSEAKAIILPEEISLQCVSFYHIFPFPSFSQSFCR